MKKFSLSSILSTLIVVCLSACGGGGGGNSGDGGNGGDNQSNNTPSQNMTVAEALTHMETSGALPVLDRSTYIPGPDANNNGVRDDIETYINSLMDSDPQKSALRQFSRSLNNAMAISGTNPDATTLRSASLSIVRAVHCIWTTYSPDIANSKVLDIRKFTVNTRERFSAYNAYNYLVNGFVIHRPEENTCENV